MLKLYKSKYHSYFEYLPKIKVMLTLDSILIRIFLGFLVITFHYHETLAITYPLFR